MGLMGWSRDCKYTPSLRVSANRQVSAGTFLGEVSLFVYRRVWLTISSVISTRSSTVFEGLLSSMKRRI